ncbi:MAG: ABC transporter ATP-binding protein [bacterium]
MANSIISVKNVSKTYHLGDIQVRALQNINLEIKRGDFAVIVGRNGSGKSTLLHQLGLIDLPDKGEIYFHDREVVHMPEKRRRELRLSDIGYIFQNYALIAELTALENVMLPAMMKEETSVCKKRAKGLLVKVGLEKRLTHLSKQLSGGEQQKVAIARSLINNPIIILADEPTANLDTTAAKDVMQTFQKLNREDGLTVVMITHEPEETVYANKQIKLSDGRII